VADSHDEDLIRKDRVYDDPLTTAVIEQYKAYVQTADNVSARRVSTSRYLLTLSVALIAVYGFQSSFPDNWYVVALATVGVVVSCLWLVIIKSYRDLNRVKFNLIHELEQHLPADLFTREWRMTEKDDKSYIRATDVERTIPFLFIAIHVLLLIALFLFKS